MSRAFLICPEPVRTITAGVGSRFVALSKTLADAGNEVTLAVPNDPTEADLEHDGVTVVQAVPETLGAQADGHDWVLLHAHLGNHYLSQRDDLPVVVDLYDPFLVENMHYHREMGLQPYRTDHATWRLQMARGDFFLCSSEEQRFYYLGWLTALGRVNPEALDTDPTLARLISELPFGTPDEAPNAALPREDVLPGVGAGAPVLYFGGIYDWYDPGVVLDALPQVLDSHPDAVLLFAEHPHPESTPLSVSRKTRKRAEKEGWLGTNVRFEPWRPYERRFELPQVSDLAITTHRPGLETDLSLRTRLVDLMWLGLPAVVTAGGTMARVVEDTGAGLVVPPANAGELAQAICDLLGNRETREAAGEAGREWAAERTWRRTAAPLLHFAEKPWRDPSRERFENLAPGAVAAEEPLLRRIQRALRRQGRDR